MFRPVLYGSLFSSKEPIESRGPRKDFGIMYTMQERTIASRFVDGGTAVFTAPPAEDAVEKLKRRLDSLEIEGQTFYVAEGDLLLDEDELRVYALQRQGQELQKLIGTTSLTE